MSDTIDIPKLKSFVEAAMTNSLHPLYKVGFAQSEILRHYWLNVRTIAAVAPEQWFKDYPKWTAQLAEAMALTESMAAEDAAKAKDAVSPVVAELTAKVNELGSKLAEATAAIAALTPKPADAEPATEDAK